MPSDLKVVNVKLPSPLKAPCLSDVVLTIRNDGTDPPDADEFDVSVDLIAGESPPVHFETIVRGRETPHIGVGQTIDVVVSVRFPCQSPVRVFATVDSQSRVGNNLRTAPSQSFLVTPTLVPQLVLSARVGIRGASRIVTWDPPALCPGKPVVVDFTITNTGCVTANQFQTDVTLEDLATPPVGLTGAVSGVHGLGPGQSVSNSFDLGTPSSVTTTSGTLAVRVVADSTNANPDQCDRSQLSFFWARPFTIGSAPRLTFRVDGRGAVRPGEQPAFFWMLENDCTDIGNVTVDIRFGTTSIYSGRSQIGARTSASESIAPARVTILPAIANAFWTIGMTQVDLEIKSLNAGGPTFTASASLPVVAEVIDATWWTWGSLAAGSVPRWKSTYAFNGTFSNTSFFAAMTVTALTVLEHPTDVTGTAEDRTLTPVAGAAPFTVPSFRSAPTTTTTSRQDWRWIEDASWIEMGPRSRTFAYTATFALTDAFGNVYAPVSSSAFLLVVPIPFSKTAKYDAGWIMISVGLGFLVAAVVAGAAGGPYGWIAAVILAAIGMALIIGATLLMYDAVDPPVPDFGERSRWAANPRLWRIPEPDDARLHPLHTLALLVGRLVAARVVASEETARAWAAFVDGDEPKRARHRETARDNVAALHRVVDALVNAADESEEIWREIVRATPNGASSESIRSMLPRFASELGLTDQELAIVETAVVKARPENMKRATEQLRGHGFRTVVHAAQAMRDDMAGAMEATEFLR